MIDNPEYRFYVIVQSSDGRMCIESGWKFRSDAKDQLNALVYDGIRSQVGGIYAYRTLSRMNLNSRRDSDWCGRGWND